MAGVEGGRAAWEQEFLPKEEHLEAGKCPHEGPWSLG